MASLYRNKGECSKDRRGWRRGIIWTGNSCVSVVCVLLCRVTFWNSEMEKLFASES
jgi:hypothetical protein